MNDSIFRPSEPVYVTWHGGASYSPGDFDSLEKFPTLLDAQNALVERADIGHYVPQHFRYVNRPEEHVLTPAVDLDTTEMWVYCGDDPTEDRDPYPDLQLSLIPNEKGDGYRVSSEPC